MSFSSRNLEEFPKLLHIAALIHPEAIIIKISAGASTMPSSPSNKKPEPKRYRWPLKRTISPIYIMSTAKDAIIEGSNAESIFFLLTRKEPTYTPVVIPIKEKK